MCALDWRTTELKFFNQFHACLSLMSNFSNLWRYIDWLWFHLHAQLSITLRPEFQLRLVSAEQLAVHHDRLQSIRHGEQSGLRWSHKIVNLMRYFSIFIPFVLSRFGMDGISTSHLWLNWAEIYPTNYRSPSPIPQTTGCQFDSFLTSQ